MKNTQYLENKLKYNGWINCICEFFGTSKNEANLILKIDEKLNNDISINSQLNRISNYFKNLDHKPGESWKQYTIDVINLFTPAYNEWINNK